MGLSEFKTNKAKPGEKPYNLGDPDGLFLLVRPSGSKLWQQKIRLAGKKGYCRKASIPQMD